MIADTAPTTRPAISPAEPLLRIDHLKISPAADDGWCDLQFRLRPAEGKATVLVPAVAEPIQSQRSSPRDPCSDCPASMDLTLGIKSSS